MLSISKQMIYLWSCMVPCACVNACSHASICVPALLKPHSDLSSEVIGAPSGKALNNCEMLMQLIREAKKQAGKGVESEGRAGWVKRRAKAEIQSAQGEGKGTNHLQVCESFQARARLLSRVWCQSEVIGNMCPNQPDRFWLKACPLFYQGDTQFSFSGSLFLISCLLSGLFVLLSLHPSLSFSLSLLFALLFCLSICLLFPLFLLPPHMHKHIYFSRLPHISPLKSQWGRH